MVHQLDFHCIVRVDGFLKKGHARKLKSETAILLETAVLLVLHKFPLLPALVAVRNHWAAAAAVAAGETERARVEWYSWQYTWGRLFYFPQQTSLNVEWPIIDYDEETEEQQGV